LAPQFVVTNFLKIFLTSFKKCGIIQDMKKISNAMHVVTTTRKVKDKVYTATLLCRSYREGGKVKKQTLANLSRLSKEQVETLRRQLKGEEPVFLEDKAQPSEMGEGLAHGNVLAVMTAINRLKLPEIIGPACRERDLTLAMVANRILSPASKLAASQWWRTTTLPDFLGLEGVEEDELYAAMDWLHPRQENIEKSLSKRHLHTGDSVFYDLSSSYMEGKCCPLAKYGYSRDKKRGKLQINYGLLADRRGCPIRIELFPGNASDASTFTPMAEKARREFGLSKIIFVGDRGMLGTKNIQVLKGMEGVDWISALKSVSIKSLVEENDVWRSLFDEVNLIEIVAPEDYPGERLIVCRNPFLANHRRDSREKLLNETAKILDQFKARVEAGRLKGEGAINFAVGQKIDKFKMKKHFILDISGNSFNYTRDEAKINAEAVLDGLYVIRTSLDKDFMSPEDCVKEYKRLTKVERVFRSMKTTDLNVRPVHHYTETRVRSHFFICMLAYYVVWHMKEAWREITFADENINAEQEARDPVAPAKRSSAALKKASGKTDSGGDKVSSFQIVLKRLSTHVQADQILKIKNGDNISYRSKSKLTDFHEKALKLLQGISI
jgi:transposase